MSDLILVLASNSPRRRQMLAWGGWEYIVQPADIDEILLTDEKPATYVLRLAEEKARAVGTQVQPGVLVVAADTTVADGALVLGKPSDPQEAVAMLKQLRG
ncbi:MAG: Maf family protein, partial [Anaerolineales bacterium]